MFEFPWDRLAHTVGKIDMRLTNMIRDLERRIDVNRERSMNDVSKRVETIDRKVELIDGKVLEAEDTRRELIALVNGVASRVEQTDQVLKQTRIAQRELKTTVSRWDDKFEDFKAQLVSILENKERGAIEDVKSLYDRKFVFLFFACVLGSVAAVTIVNILILGMPAF